MDYKKAKNVPPLYCGATNQELQHIDIMGIIFHNDTIERYYELHSPVLYGEKVSSAIRHSGY